jgi:hypothetical protein
VKIDLGTQKGMHSVLALKLGVTTTLSGTLGSKGTLLVSHFGSIGLLVKLPSLFLLMSPLPFFYFFVLLAIYIHVLEQNVALYFLHLFGCHEFKSPLEWLALLDRGKGNEALL